jgi:hypothetical protein
LAVVVLVGLQVLVGPVELLLLVAEVGVMLLGI